MKNQQSSKNTRFLLTSMILVILLSVFIFGFLAIYMNQKSADTIGQVGNIYMTSMGEQISQHFATTIDLRLSQVETIVETNPPSSLAHRDDLWEHLMNLQPQELHIILSYALGLSDHQISEEMNMPRRTVSAKRNRILDLLRRELERSRDFEESE